MVASTIHIRCATFGLCWHFLEMSGTVKNLVIRGNSFLHLRLDVYFSVFTGRTENYQLVIGYNGTPSPTFVE